MTTVGPQPDSLRRAGLSTLAASMMSVAVSFLTSVLIARVLDPAEKGTLNLAVTTASLAAMVLGVAGASGITLAVARGISSPLPLVKVLSGWALLQVPVTLMVLWAASLIAGASIVASDGAYVGIMLVAVLAAASSARQYFRSILIGLQQIVSASWRDTAALISGAVILLVGLLGAGQAGVAPSPTMVLLLTVVASVVAALLMLHGIWRLSLEVSGPAATRAITRFGAPLYAGNLVQFLNYRLDFFIVAALSGTRDVGLYALAVSLAQLLWLVSEAAAIALLARTAAGSRADSAGEAAQLTRVTLAIGALSAIILAVAATPLVKVIYGTAYSDSVLPLLFLLPGIVCYIAVKVLASYVVGVGQSRILLVVSLIGLCGTLSLDILLIPPLGAVGAAIASSVSYSVSAIIMVAWAVRLSRLPVRDVLLVRRSDIQRVRNAIAGLGR